MAPPRPKVSFLSAQIDTALAAQPQTTSMSPFYLFVSDVALFFQNTAYVPGTVLPLAPWPSGALDELYPNLPNLIAIAVHVFLILVELVFLLSFPLGIFVVGAVWILYCAVVILFVRLVCFLALNGGRSGQMMWSDEKIVEGYEQHAGEAWVFVNGVAVGKHWLKSNLDRLSLTFRRCIIGVHNPTSGIIQCLVQRDFSYVTLTSARSTLTSKPRSLHHPYTRVVPLAHSQGGTIASMAELQRLTCNAELPGSALRKLEVYTSGLCGSTHRALREWRRLTLAGDRFSGRVFARLGVFGYQLDQHYLDGMFPLNPARSVVLEHNPLIDAVCGVNEGLVLRREGCSHYEHEGPPFICPSAPFAAWRFWCPRTMISTCATFSMLRESYGG